MTSKPRLCLLLLCAVCIHAKKIVVSTHDAPAAIGPYSQAIMLVGKESANVHVAGQIGLTTNGTLVGGIDAQTKQALTNINNIIGKAFELLGLPKQSSTHLEAVYQCEVLMKDLSQYEELNKIYAATFSGPDFPARAAYQVAALPKDALTEIKCDAYVEL